MTRFWIPFGVLACFMTFVAMSCYAHRRPVRIDNDMRGRVRADLSRYKLLEQPELITLDSGEGFGAAFCSKDLEFAYLSTAARPGIVAYRMKDICDPDDCSCEIKVSELDRRRKDLSVPWQKAGSIFPPGARQ